MKMAKFIEPSRDETDVIGTHAHVWLARMKTGNAADDAELLRWLRKSPLHVREMLLATTWDTVLNQLSMQREKDVAEQAHQWLDRLERSHDPNDCAEFMAWLKESPLHVRAVLSVTTVDATLPRVLDPEHKQEFQAVVRQKNVVPLRSGADQDIGPATVKPRTMRDERLGWSSLIGLAAAACVAIAIAISWSRLVDSQQQFNTSIGEQRSIGLSDGSIVHMNTRSRVRVNLASDARDIYLLEGQMIFKVKHDPTRPFRVHVNGAVVQAIGTEFDVRRIDDRTKVAVIEGVVQVIAGTEGKLDAETLAKLPGNTKVPAGESVVITADGKLTQRVTMSSRDASAWQQRRLIFRNHALAEIVAEFNRYNRVPQIRIEGEALQTTTYSGIFNADDPESLLQSLASDERLAIDRNRDNVVVIRLQSSYVQTVPAIQQRVREPPEAK